MVKTVTDPGQPPPRFRDTHNNDTVIRSVTGPDGQVWIHREDLIGWLDQYTVTADDPRAGNIVKHTIAYLQHKLATTVPPTKRTT
uniref:hypothetical protein n=1 Tax=Amycolatopsis sp. CA-096443 TaxID=3239919 RepID=UPI003F493BCA